MPRKLENRMTAWGILVVITAIGLAAWVPAGAGAPPPKSPKSGTVRFDDGKANSIDPGDLIPTDRRTTWNPGIPGGIPKVTTTFATINAATYGTGVTDAQAVINKAIAAAGAVATENNRQIVFLPKGTYRITGAIGLFSSNVVLRGAGPDKTRIRLDSSTPTSVIQFGVPGFWPSYSPAIDGAPGWQETGLDAAHQAFSHSDLFEGNWATNLSADSTHGNTGFHVFFRNYAHGRNTSPPVPDNANLAAVGLGGYSREHTFIANVLNQTGTGIVYEANPSQNTGVSLPAIYRLGYASLGGSFENLDDGTAAARIYRHGNWDPVSNAVVWDPKNRFRKLPDSLFHRSKPSFFGSLDWPWVNPNGATPAARVKVLPAKQRYDRGTPFASG